MLRSAAPRSVDPHAPEGSHSDSPNLRSEPLLRRGRRENLHVLRMACAQCSDGLGAEHIYGTLLTCREFF